MRVQHTVRQWRDFYIAQTDWTQAIDSPLSESKKAEWQTYRQALRDIPLTYPDDTPLEDVIWPTPPLN